MTHFDCIVLGANGLLGSSIAHALTAAGKSVLSIHRDNYDTVKGCHGAVFINCNGNSYRFRANQDPAWDFQASVASVDASLFDFKFDRYVYLSTVDVYNCVHDRAQTLETTPIQSGTLMPYAFHKWLSERLVERFAANHLILRLSTVLGPKLKKNPVYDLLHGSPLFLSPESEISFIDTETVSAALIALLKGPPVSGIFNIAPTGATRLSALAARLGRNPKVASESDGTLYRYDIDNRKISTYLAMPTSDQVVHRYVDGLHLGVS